jgi:sulfatase maturation enzyme AslB (radical SAM superfamily)
MIWGGEAELSNSFPVVLQHLHDHGVSVGMVTNGTLLDRFASLIDCCVDKLYLSVDGTPEIHDCIRGKGTFEKIKNNLVSLHSGNMQRIIMTVITDEMVNHLEAVLDSYCSLKPDLVILQDMISLNKEEVVRYEEWSREVFNQDAPMIGSWAAAWQEQVNRRRRAVEVVSFLAEQACRSGRSERYPFEIQYLPHRSTLSCFLPHEIEALYRINGVDNIALPVSEPHAYGSDVNLICTSAWHHLHVGWNGEVSFCTDFTDISMGNIMESMLLQIMNGEKAKRFRKEIESGNCVCCRHCSWCYKKDYTRL